MPASMAAGMRGRPQTPASIALTATSRAAAPTSWRSSTTARSPARNAAYTYGELLTEVQALAQVLRDKGVNKGDRVIIYMPMVPEAAFAMLACARLGAIHSVVFGGFAANELATRIDDVDARADHLRILRHRAWPRHCLQAAARQGDRPCQRTRSGNADPAARAAALRTRRRARFRLRSTRRQGRRGADGAMRRGRRDRPALRSLHLRHDRPAQGRRARQWRPHGRARLVDGAPCTASSPAKCSGPPPMSAGWSAIPTSSTPRC